MIDNEIDRAYGAQPAHITHVIAGGVGVPHRAAAVASPAIIVASSLRRRSARLAFQADGSPSTNRAAVARGSAPHEPGPRHASPPRDPQAPRPSGDHVQYAHTRWWHLLCPSPYGHFRQLRERLDPFIRQLAGRIDNALT
jgi:hypothetical protein